MTNNVLQNLSSLQQNQGALMSPQGANQHNQGKSKSKSVGKIADSQLQDSTGRAKAMRKNSQISRQKMMLSPERQMM